MSLINTAKVTTIANSRGEFNIFTYPAYSESVDDVKESGFLNNAYSFVNSGDILRVFKYDQESKLIAYLEFLIIEVSQKDKIVESKLITEVLLDKKALNKKKNEKDIEAVIKEQIEELLENKDLKSIVTKIVNEIILKEKEASIKDNG